MDVFNIIASTISNKCSERVHQEVEVGTIIFTKAHGYLGECKNARALEEGFKL